MKKEISKWPFTISDLSCRNYQFILSNASSVRKHYTENGEVIRFTFDEKNGIFDSQEKPFIRNIMFELLERKGNVASIIDSDIEYFPFYGIYIKSKTVKCGNLSISVVPTNGKLFDCVKEIVDEYNKELNRPKVYMKKKGD